MALPRPLTRLDLAVVNQTLAENGIDPLESLSQRKLNSLGLPLAYVDRHQRYRFANSAFLEWVSARREDDVIGKRIVDVVGNDVYQLYQAYVEAALAGERTGFVRQLVAPGQPAIWIRVDYYPDRSQTGQVRGFLATYSDVDHLKRLELEAGQREHRLRLVTDSVELPILHFDRDFRLHFANRPFADWIGVPADDLLGHKLKDFLPSDALDELVSQIERVFEGATVSYERRERTAGGDLRWVRVTLFPDREVSGRVGGAFAVWNDIEDDIRIRDALKSQQAQLRLFADNIPGPIAYLDKSLHYSSSTRRSPIASASRSTRSTARAPFEVLTPDVAAFLRPILKRAQAGEHVEYERIGQDAKGQRRWMHGRIAPDLDATGNVRGLYCTEYDIDDLKQTEQALAAREEQLRLFTDNIPEPVDLPRCAAPVCVRQRFVLRADRPRARPGDRPADRGRRRTRSLARAVGVRRPRAGRRSGDLRARGDRRRQSPALAARTHRPRPQVRRHDQGRLRHRARHLRPEAACRTRWRRARGSSARSWTACRRRSRTSTATSAATTSTARSSSTSA